MKKRLVALFLALVTLASILVVPASAATVPSVSTSAYVLTHFYSSSGKATGYENENLSGSTVKVSKDTPMHIVDIEDDVVYAKYQKSDGTYSSPYWFKMDEFTYADLTASVKETKTISKKLITYSYKYKTEELSTAAKGTKVYVLRGNASSDWVQVFWKRSNGTYIMGWVLGADLYGTQYKSGDSSITLNGKTISSYAKGDTYTKSEYGASQCLAFARYCQQKYYGANEYSNSSKFDKIYKNTAAKDLTASKVKEIIFEAGVGAHIRTNNEVRCQHSMIVINITSDGFTILDANGTGGSNTVGIKTYTWSGYASSWGKRGIKYVAVYDD